MQPSGSPFEEEALSRYFPEEEDEDEEDEEEEEEIGKGTKYYCNISQ